MYKPKYMKYEYWPFWLFYAPFVPYWLLNSAKSGSLNYFCRVNPGIRFGGFLDYSKFKILEQVPEKHKPESRFISEKSQLKTFPEFPFVVKPDQSERGRNVEVISSLSDWENYPVQKNLILQEYVTKPLEFGIFYARFPNREKGKILSITGKDFLRWESDGKTTLSHFVHSNYRAEKRKKYLENKFNAIWDEILPKGTSILLEPIGNHNRGTRFFDASELITDELEETVDRISQNIKGFYYGRFDVKADSVKKFQSGDFSILEINGANSEPTHIYDSKFNLLQAWAEAKKHFDVQYKIASANKESSLENGFFRAVLSRLF